MSWDIYADEINWMNSVLQKYSDRKAILSSTPTPAWPTTATVA